MLQHTPQKHQRRRHAALAAAILTGAVATAALLLPGAVAVRAQDSPKPVSIALFRGDLEQASNVRLGSWGSGRAEKTKDFVLVGDSSILLTTAGFYQGGRLDFANPVDLSGAFANPNTYVRLRLRFNGAGSTQNQFDFNSFQTSSKAASPFERMRFLLTMADGTSYELLRPVEVLPTDDPGGYVNVSFPVLAIRKKNADGTPAAAPSGEGARLQRLVIFGDKYAKFNIGEIDVITDETPIVPAPLDLPPSFAEDAITFTGSAEAGASTLRYSWDFDASDGIQNEAEGRSVTHVYKKEGTYKVTLTISDVDGIKKPVTETATLDVSK